MYLCGTCDIKEIINQGNQCSSQKGLAFLQAENKQPSPDLLSEALIQPGAKIHMEYLNA